jgi:uncharacterized protein YceK
MRGKPILLAVLIMIPTVGGCATYGSLTDKDGCKVFGGTRLDATIISENLGPDPADVRKKGIEPPVMVWAACCGMIDMPFSLLADTVMLPVTVPLAFQGSTADSPKEDAAHRPAK